MKTKEMERIELTPERVHRLLERAKAVLEEEDYRDLENLVKSFAYLTQLLEDKRMTVSRLRKLLFGFKSEKLKNVLENLNQPSQGEVTEGVTDEEKKPAAGEETKTSHGEDGGGAPAARSAAPAPGGEEGGEKSSEEKEKRKGHGRAGADAYEGAERISIKHPSLKPGDPCPVEGCNGRVYLFVPQKLVRIAGQAPVAATVSEIERLRCNLCLQVFSAPLPADTEFEKYNATAASMIALLRYGTGVPFNRLEGLQKSFGIPLPASTQWDIVNRASKKIAPAFAALIEEAAQGDVFYNDDTPMKILELMKKRKKVKADDG
jgi:hypothetical protein